MAIDRLQMEYNVCKECGAKDGMAGILIDGNCLTCREKKENTMEIEKTVVKITTDDIPFLLELVEFLNNTTVPQGSTVVRFECMKEKVTRGQTDATR